jgi:Rho GTPase-activating protein 1
VAASILYRSPITSKDGRPIYILNAAALPDTREADFDALLPYVLARLPGEDELLRGSEYEVVFFAGGGSEGATSARKNRPGWGWFIQAYHVLSRAMRKRLQKLYIVHERSWVRILVEMFSTIVSPKFRRKIVHGMYPSYNCHTVPQLCRVSELTEVSYVVSTLSNLALHVAIEDLLIPPSAYLHDRRLSDEIFAPYATGRRAFAVREPLPNSSQGPTRLPRVLRETTDFVLLEENITTEGLFRIPPHSKLKEILKEAYDRGQKFIIWKEGQTVLPIPQYARSDGIEEAIGEIDQRDAYGVTMAAGLIKSWYADLRQPIFPQSTYKDLKRLFGDPDELPSLERLTELISPTSEWSILPSISREIMTRHLLPLLSAIAARQDANKMNAENLAVCFAPALLRGPDQLEDAKTSSIIRRIMMVAVDLWPSELGKNCGIDPAVFRKDLALPSDSSDWEDPLEGKLHAQVPDEVDEVDEKHFTGIILEDNEAEAASNRPPPLPPRWKEKQPVSPGISSDDSATKRKPAPPLMVPPRYSTIIPDSPLDVAESPVSYSAVADGFAPPRPSQWESPDEKKSGTNSAGEPPTPTIVLPKRKALTQEQIGNAETAATQSQPRAFSDSRMALPGMTGGASPIEPVKRKPVQMPKHTPSTTAETGAEASSPTTSQASAKGESTGPSWARRGSVDPQPVNEFRRPSWPASANRTPTINSLARPVYPSSTASKPPGSRPPSKSTSLPVPGPKPRAPSAGLLQRMPSFEPTSSPPPSNGLVPRRLNLKKASVDDLRRLYEERAGTAKSLVEAGLQN